jgi:hypothetical protein
MECECEKGWGGEFCFQEYCPNNCEEKMNFGRCMSTDEVRAAANADSADAAAADATLHPVCWSATERTNLRAKHFPAQWCHDLSSDADACSNSYVSKSKPDDPTHEIALCVYDHVKKECGHEDCKKF